MLQPKRTKFRRLHRLRGRNQTPTNKGSFLAFGDIGIKATTAGELTARQIESARRVIARAVKRGGRIWIRVFPDKVLTAKGSEMPMGKGKGAPDRWVAPVRPGTIIFEMSGVESGLMRKALNLATYKLCVGCKVVDKEI